jgi:hypothetical protein
MTNLAEFPAWIIKLAATAAIIGLAAAVLWLRDRWWDRKAKSQAERERYQEKLNTGSRYFSVVFDLFIAAAFLIRASRGSRPGEYIFYGLVGVLFIWLAYKSWMRVAKDSGPQHQRPPGAPPPIE